MPFRNVAKKYGFPTIEIPRSASTMELAVRHLVAQLAYPLVLDPEDVVLRIMKRESLGSTQVRDIAIAHCVTKSVTVAMGVVGHSADGIQWGEPNESPVRTVCFLVSDDEPRCYSLYVKMLLDVMQDTRSD